MPIYSETNAMLIPAVELALPKPDVIEVKNRTLDGAYHIQMIGTGGTVVDVTAYATLAEKRAFDDIKRNGSIIKVTFDGQYWLGLIDGDLGWERIPNQDSPMFKASFTLAVTEEGVL